MKITPSPELIAVSTRWSNAIDARDGETLRNLLSTSEHLRYIGSAEGELWAGKVLRDGIGDHFREVPDYEVGEMQIEAFECGPVGWAYWMVPLRFTGSDAFIMHRITIVFALEQGSWKIVHIHMSNPMANIDKMGVENTVLGALMAAARDGLEDIGHEGIAAVMFTDIADSSQLANLAGDRVWARTIKAHLAAVAVRIADAGGTLVKSLGDGTLSTYPSARAALVSAQAIQRMATAPGDGLPLRVRIGIDTGAVIQADGDFFGTVVNKAARITAVAAPDEIRASDATRQLLGSGDGFAFDDPQQVELKGLEGSHLIHRLTY